MSSGRRSGLTITSGDKCSGNPAQPFRIPGAPNLPNLKKRERDRIVVPTKLLRLSDRTYTAADLQMVFSPSSQAESNSTMPVVAHNPVYCCNMAMMILASDPATQERAIHVGNGLRGGAG